MQELVRIPGSEKIKIKESFEKRYREILKDEYDEFIRYSLSFLRQSIRVNTLKANVDETRKRIEKKGFSLEPIPWCKEGFWIYGERKDIGNLLEHSLGYIYVQEAMSMVPPVVLEPKPGENILDLCAAPGSKTTQIAQYMENKGVLVANDITPVRARPLGINVQRCGIQNIMLTLTRGQELTKRFPEGYFDKILVDAPCSGTGTIRKSLKTLWQTSEGFVKKMAREQKKLVSSAFRVLKKGGTMVYSTCTLEPSEDEETISYLLDNFDCKTEKILLPKLKSAEPITEWNNKKFNDGVKNCLRVYPHQNDTEGFFVCKIVKL
ncbi:MAG: NOL1/NOP2/sun family putative RNA methylase [Candidatus Woesearchaeota archaeon]